jgi:hypothetical protein
VFNQGQSREIQRLSGKGPLHLAHQAPLKGITYGTFCISVALIHPVNEMCAPPVCVCVCDNAAAVHRKRGAKVTWPAHTAALTTNQRPEVNVDFLFPAHGHLITGEVVLPKLTTVRLGV